MEDNINPCWRKASYSGNGGGSCVEVADQAARVLVRDTQDRTGPVLRFTPAAWRRFADRVKRSLADPLPVLGVPADHDVAFMFGIGYPADRPRKPMAKPDRRPLDEVIHHVRW